MSRVLVLSPHPDDEAIGLGGTLCRHLEDGDTVRVIFLTSGERGGHGRSAPDTARIREQEARAAAAILGISQFDFWREPDGALRPTPALVEKLRVSLRRWPPRVLYLPHAREMHCDHRAAVRLVRAALSGPGEKLWPPEVLMFELWTPLQRLDHIVDISPFIERKLAAIRAYRSQCAAVGFVAASRGLARYRGELHSWPGGDYAEVFARLTRPRTK